MILRDLKPGDVFRYQGSLWTKSGEGHFFHIAILRPQEVDTRRPDPAPSFTDDEVKVDYVHPLIRGVL